MRTSELLNECRYSSLELRDLQDRREELLSRLLPSGIQPREVDVQTSTPGDRVADIMILVCELDGELTRKIMAILMMQREAQHCIDQLKDARQRYILNRYYLSPKLVSHAELAKEVGLDEKTLYNVRREAVRALDQIRRGKQ